MAVYTEVSDDDLAAFIASYDLGALLSYKGIAEGVENTNYLVHTAKGPYFLTLYEKRVAPADLPFFLGLMEHLSKAGLTCPTPVRDAEGRMLRTLCRPARRARHVSGRRMDQAAAAAPLRGRGRGPGEAASGRPRFSPAPRQRSGAVGLAPALRALPVARRRDRAAAGGDYRAGARRSGSTLARRPGAGHHSCRPVSRQRVLPRRPAVRPHRLLFRLQRRTGLRHRRHAQRLVLRERPFLQHHQGRRRCSRAIKACARWRRPSARRCRCWRAAQRCASCSRAPTTGCTRPATRSSIRKDPAEYLRRLKFHRTMRSPANTAWRQIS